MLNYFYLKTFYTSKSTGLAELVKALRLKSEVGNDRRVRFPCPVVLP